MRNPWADLPDKHSELGFILPQDEEALREAKDWDANFKFHTNLMPEPYFGSSEAPVVLLMSNSGVGAGDAAVHRNPCFQHASRQSLLHDASNGAFLHLRADLNTDGRRYWERRTRVLREALKRDPADDLLVLQLLPYHSRKFRPPRTSLPSQQYTLYLLDEAIKRGAMVIAMRSASEWLRQDSLLAKPGYRLWRSRVPRSTYLTPGVLGNECYAALLARLLAS